MKIIDVINSLKIEKPINLDKTLAMGPWQKYRGISIGMLELIILK